MNISIDRYCTKLDDVLVIQELWALLNFADSSKFGNLEDFMKKFGDLKDVKQVAKLHETLKPYLLRRIKEDVLKSLPPKEEIIVEVALTSIQKRFYRAIYERNTSFLYKGLKASNQPSLMNVMMELRKCCNHPYLVKGVEERVLGELSPEEKADEGILLRKLIESSGKLVLLDKLLPRLYSEGHKVLIFSQMVRVLNLLEDFLKFRGYAFERLDGSTRSSDRKDAVERFCTPSANKFVMLLSTKAGGLGLNLTAADTVIIFDSDWNPMNDLQSQARAHRIGQTKAVMVYRLLTRKTYGKFEYT
jgi:chromodomain-helicase-DNA-binding protein 7